MKEDSERAENSLEEHRFSSSAGEMA